MSAVLLLLGVLRSLVEVAGLFLLGQGVLYLLAGASREQNGIYLLFRLLTRPVLRVARVVTPRLVLDRHLPFVAFGLLFWLWIALAYLRRAICVGNGLAC
ncbi:MAG TPA: hypothetical protein VFY24_04180 [Azospira sp.]|nr:hypothetical protein [Azospira sp.]